jgi:hypothetical protein
VSYEINFDILFRKIKYLRPPETHITLNGRNSPFVNHVKYLGVIYDERITWRLDIEVIEAKDFTAFIRMYFLFKSERLSANIKLTLHESLIRSVMTYACPACELAAHTHINLKIAAPAKQGSAHHWISSKGHTGPRFAHNFQPSVCM